MGVADDSQILNVIREKNVIMKHPGVSYFEENGNLPIFKADNWKIVYISAYFGHKKCDGNENINLQGYWYRNSYVIGTPPQSVPTLEALKRKLLVMKK